MSISMAPSKRWVSLECDMLPSSYINICSQSQTGFCSPPNYSCNTFQTASCPSWAFIYNLEAEYASLNKMVQDYLAAIFHLHSTVNMELLLLMPITDPEEVKNQAMLIDRYGNIVALPYNILVAFARLAAQESIRRIKRYISYYECFLTQV